MGDLQRGKGRVHSTVDTTAKNLDMAVEKDRAIVRRTCSDPLNYRQRWPISPEFRAELVAALKNALQLASIDGDARQMDQCIRTAALLEAMNQSDEHHAEKIKRLDDGKVTEIVAHAEYRVMFDNEANGG